MKKLILFFLLVLAPVIAFSQDESKKTTVPFFPSPAPKSDLETKIAAEKNVIKLSWLNSLLAYKAVRTEDLSVCQTQDCNKHAQDLLQMRYMAEGRCEKLRSKSEQELCAALKSNDCNQVSGSVSDLCKAISDGDADQMVKITNQAAVNEKSVATKKTSKEKKLKFLGIFSGFKHYSPMPCERYLNSAALSLTDKLSCSVLFAADPDAAIDSILRDLAILSLTYKNNDLSLCDLIKNPAIKNACTKNRKKVFSDVF